MRAPCGRCAISLSYSYNSNFSCNFLLFAIISLHMTMERSSPISDVQELATTIGAFLFTTESMVAQSNKKLIRLVVETLIVEFD